MVQASDPDRVKELVTMSIPEGAEAFGMQFCRMKSEYRRPEVYRELFECTKGLPVYVTNYRDGENGGKSDDLLADELVELAECGATLCDVMGDLFSPHPDQMTEDAEAIEKQKKLKLVLILNS